ncbi:MAG: FAD-binding protein [Deltaproteobacteria bacterium]|nr:FAD-binding protein [Deltaproteobacteria bacterium]
MAKEEKKKKKASGGNGNTGAVMVVGAGIAGIQAALDLAKAGLYVHLVETKPAIGGIMAQLDKTFPTNDCSMCIISPKLVECGRHLNIEIHTLTDVKEISGEPGNFQVKLEKHPRYVDMSKCTGCSDCTKVCPVAMPNEFNAGLGDWQAIYRLYPQAIPSAFGIKKLDRAPCVQNCPANLSAQGYVQLIKVGKFKESLDIIMNRLPLPGVIGRVCPHPCESVCRRAEVEEPISICSLKRFVADQVDWDTLPVPEVTKNEQPVAIIGAGPSGLACGYHLALMGYKPVIFEAAAEAGGWLRYGIPEYRLPRNVLKREVDYIQRCGVEIRLNSPLGGDRTIDSLLTKDGFRAVFLGVGCQGSLKIPVPGSDAEGVLWGVDYLKEFATTGNSPTQGKKVLVIGGGNVSMDVGQTALRNGATEVKIIALETREEMPASPWEVEEAEQAGCTIEHRWGVKQIVAEGGKVKGIELKAVERVFDEQGRFSPTYFEDQTRIEDADVVIMAIGQKAELSFITDADKVKLSPRGLIEADPQTLQTSREEVFAGGDVVSGPYIAIAAVAGGREAAISIDRYLRGQDLKEDREFPWRYDEHGDWNPIPANTPKELRAKMPHLPVAEWTKSFNEINLGFTPEVAQAEAARCVNCGVCSECMQCAINCQPKAVDHSQKPQEMDINVGAVIMSSGAKVFDPSIADVWGYGRIPNVVTSLELERILSASGPYEGHLVRPVDHKEPKKMAWLQCVGSRDVKYNSYCSSVCCMYAIKEAVISMEHSKEPLETTIFYMDMRTYGKDFELYYNRAQELGVRFIRCRVHSLDPVPGGDVMVNYVTEEGEFLSETFDMVALSVGFQVGGDVIKLAHKLGVEMTQHQLAQTDPFTPVQTSKPGVYVCGTFQAPKDIPQSVMEASAAAGGCCAALGEARWTLTKTKELPPQVDRSLEAPRIGVFLCNCGINIGGLLSMPSLKEYAATLPNVVLVEDNLFTCSQDTQDRMLQVIKDQNLNRVVVAACTPLTHEPLFRETIMDAGLNKYMFEMANIRNQDTWVHMKEFDSATEKAKHLLKMAVARASVLKPLVEKPLNIIERALVVGGGIAGMNAALNLADQGFKTILLEKEGELGGIAKKIHHTIEGLDVPAYVADLAKKVQSHDKIELYTGAEVVGFGGYKGNFNTRFKVAEEEKAIDHGVVVVATGGHEYKPKEFLYGEDGRVLTQLELGEKIHASKGEVAKWDQAVFIQCVGSRNEENPNCSRVCCQGAVKYALQLKELNPNMDVVILYRDMRTYGVLEDYYRKARDLGVIFARFDPEKAPEVTKEGDGLSVTFIDHVLQMPVKINPDALILSAGVMANDTEQFASMLKLPRNAFGYFIEAHAKLRPVDFSSEGIFLCGMAHAPKLISESIAQAMAAAARAGGFLADTKQTISGVVSHVEPGRCAACLVCVRSCPYNVPQINEDNVSEINEAICQGCGICASECPANVIQLSHYEDDQIAASILAFE